MKRRVVITGMGMVTPLGVDVESTWSSVCSGESAIKPIDRFDPTGLPVRFAAQTEAPPLQPEDEGDLKLRLAITALREALAMSGPIGGERTGVCMGSEIGRPPLPEVASRGV